MQRIRLNWLNTSLWIKSLIVVGIPVVTLLISGLITIMVLRQTQEADELLEVAMKVQTELQNVRTLLLDAGTGVRGYLLTGEDNFLVFYQKAGAELPQTLNRAISLLDNDSEQLERLMFIQEQIEQELASLNTLLNYASVLGNEAPETINGFILTSQVVMDGLSVQLQQMQDVQRTTLDLRETQKIKAIKRFYIAIICNALVGITGGLLGLWLFASGITARVRRLDQNAKRLARGLPTLTSITSEDELGRLSQGLDEASKLLIARESDLREAKEELNLRFTELTERNQQIMLLNQLSAALQQCESTEEIVDVVKTKAALLAGNSSGILYLIDEKTQLHKVVGAWGNKTEFTDSFTHRSCHVPKQGQYYVYKPQDKNVYCSHIGSAAPVASLCCSLETQDTVLGLLHVTHHRALSEGERQVFGAIADRAALSLANLKLRDTLVNQAIRDSLTGLYNRRYLEGALERELRHAERQKKSFGVIALDIDHFKQFNDTYGHDAGDEVLRAFGNLLNTSFRGEDLACRLGGEEFIVVLPGATLTQSIQSAERLVEQVRNMRVTLPGGLLEMITISSGVAIYPDHGNSIKTLLRKADAALYQAKHNGRDRVEVSTAPPETNYGDSASRALK